MKSNVFTDALELAGAIYDELHPHQSTAIWTIVNIAKNRKRTFKVSEDPEIPLSYGYTHDEAITTLQDFGVFEIGVSGMWFIDFVEPFSRYDKPKTGIVTDQDKITKTCFSLGYITSENAQYHEDIKDKNGKEITEGLHSVLVDVKLLSKYLRIAEKVNNQRDYWYENDQLKFKLANGEVDQLDFSTTIILKKLFIVFWYLWNSDGAGRYTYNQIVSKYKELNNEDLEISRIGEIVANIRASIINRKPLIKGRLEWKFDRKSGTWIFKIIPFNPLSY
jgi:hypothetical protein